jgi:hypothetical protein
LPDLIKAFENAVLSVIPDAKNAFLHCGYLSQ